MVCSVSEHYRHLARNESLSLGIYKGRPQRQASWFEHRRKSSFLCPSCMLVVVAQGAAAALRTRPLPQPTASSLVVESVFLWHQTRRGASGGGRCVSVCR